MISLAQRAGNVVSGEFATERAIQTMKARLVIVGTDSSDNTIGKFRNKCDFYNIPFYIYGTKESLAHAIGKEMRASLAITDEGMAKAVKDKLEEMNIHGKNDNT